MIGIVIRKELKALYRDPVSQVLSGFLLLTLWQAALSVQRTNKERATAQQMSREGWQQAASGPVTGY